MKRFNLLKASSLVLASYFILGFSSCSNLKKQDNDSIINSYYKEIEFNKLIFDNLNIKEFLDNSLELRCIINEFQKNYSNEVIYTFNIPRTYQEYQLYIYDGNNYINIGYVLKNGNEFIIEYFIYENGYKKNIKHTSLFNFSHELKDYYNEFTYEDLKTNYSYKEYFKDKENLKSLLYNDGKSVFEIVLSNNEQYLIKFSGDLFSNIEIDITEEEYNILMNNLIEKYYQNDLVNFIKENECLLFNILERRQKYSPYYEYNLIFNMLNELCSKSRIREK